MKKSLFFAAILFIFSFTGNAQSRSQDVIFLKSGSILRGDLVEQPDGAKYKLAMSDGSIWMLDTSDVLKSIEEPYFKPKKVILPSEKGFYNCTDIGFLFGRTDSYYSPVTFSVQMVNGYKINPHLSVGAGIGLEPFEVPLAPLFLEGRYTFFNKVFSPFISAKAGYGVPLENYKTYEGKKAHLGGILFGANVGFRKYLSDSFGFVLSLGYRYQQSFSNSDYYYWGWENNSSSTVTKRYYNRASLRLGIIFN